MIIGLGEIAILCGLLLAGCAPIEMVKVTRLDGRPCRTTKVRPDWYSAETWTDCLDKDGNAVAVATNHTDIADFAALFAFTGATVAGVAH
jgi:hypothetical protein